MMLHAQFDVLDLVLWCSVAMLLGVALGIHLAMWRN